MLLYHFPLTSSSATATIVNKGLKDDYTISGDNNFSSGGKLSAYAKDMGENKFYLSIPNFSLDYTLCFRAKATSNILLVSVGYTPFEITADNTWHDYVICDKKVYKDGLFLTNYNYSAGIVTFGDSEDSCQGLIQDIRIYDYALSRAEINEYSRALVVHYPLNGNVLNSNVIKDCSGFGNDLYYFSGDKPIFEPETPRGTKSCSWNKIGKYQHSDNFLPPYNTITFACWYKTTHISNSNFIFVHGDSFASPNVIGFYDQSVNNTTYFYIRTTGSAVNAYTTIPNDNKWHHLAYTFVFNTAESTAVSHCYVDGELKQTINFSNTLPNHTSETLSCELRNVQRAENRITDVRVYATALSAEDIKNLYNSPISLDNQNTLQCSEIVENPLYPSKYWRTPTKDEMSYILNTRTNAANLRTLGRVEISSGTYVNGCFLLPDDWVKPADVDMTIVLNSFVTNTYSMVELKKLEESGAIFFPASGSRSGSTVSYVNQRGCYKLATQNNANENYFWYFHNANFVIQGGYKYSGNSVRLCSSSQDSHSFSTSATTKIKFVKVNLQYHCTQHIWRFAEHSYDIIGAANANISDSYNGWIDLFGYGTSGVHYSPTLHSTNNADYASGDIANTDNDWGVNEIQSYDYNVKNFAANKNGIVQHNELRENDSEVNGFYNNKLITNELIEN